MEFEKNRITDDGKFLTLRGEKLKSLGGDHELFSVNYVPEEREERLKVLKEMYIGRRPSTALCAQQIELTSVSRTEEPSTVHKPVLQ